MRNNIFEAVEKKEIAKDSLIDILADISKTGKLNLEHFKLEDIDLEQAVKELIKEKPGGVKRRNKLIVEGRPCSFNKNKNMQAMLEKK